MTKTKTKKNCPVESIAREVANLIRLQEQSSTEGFGERTNLGNSYAHTLICERIEALTKLSVYEVPVSEIGQIFHLMLARSAMPVSEMVCTKVFENHPAEQRDALRRENICEQYIESVILTLTNRCNDPDIETLSERYGVPQEGRSNCLIMAELKRLQAA